VRRLETLLLREKNKERPALALSVPLQQQKEKQLIKDAQQQARPVEIIDGDQAGGLLQSEMKLKEQELTAALDCCEKLKQNDLDLRSNRQLRARLRNGPIFMGYGAGKKTLLLVGAMLSLPVTFFNILFVFPGIYCSWKLWKDYQKRDERPAVSQDMEVLEKKYASLLKARSQLLQNWRNISRDWPQEVFLEQQGANV